MRRSMSSSDWLDGDDNREAVDIAVIEDLEQLLLGPGGGILGAEIVQDQQRCVADLFEAFFEGGFGALIGEAQPVQQVGDGEKQGGDAQLDGLVGDSSGQVGLAAAVITQEEQPALERGGKLAGVVVGALERSCLLISHPNPALRAEGLKGQPLERVEVAEHEEPLVDGLADLCLAAGADVHLAEIRVADREILAQVADPAADRAVRIAGQVGASRLNAR